MTDPRAIVLRRLRARPLTQTSLLAALVRAGVDHLSAERVLEQLFGERLITLETRHGGDRGRGAFVVDRVVLTDRGRELGGAK